MDGPILGVMTLYLNDNRLEELSYFRSLALQGEKLGLDVMVFTPDDVRFDRKKVFGLFYDARQNRWVRRWTGLPKLIYDRCRIQQTPRYERLRRFRAAFPGLRYMNKPIALKWGIYRLLEQHDSIHPHLPRTVMYRQPTDLLRMVRQHGLVYLKPVDGTGGRGILRIERLPGGLCSIRGRDRRRRIIQPQTVNTGSLCIVLSEWELKDRYLVQRGIRLTLQDGRVHDYRLLMQKNAVGEWEATGCAGRIGPARSITSNLHGGGSAVPMRKLLRMRFDSEEEVEQIQATIERLGYEVARVLEQKYGQLCELALDIAVDGDGNVWLLEVNPKPAREVFRRIGEKETYDRAIARPLEYAKYLLEEATNGR